jgi:lipopolysaccharide/colanic/teichoic acid biosynthesis glycosyltransferase
MRVPFYEMRLLVTPGATGWAHVNMENDASVEDAPEKMQYDLYYVKNRSFLLDMLILLRSLFILIKRNGR